MPAPEPVPEVPDWLRTALEQYAKAPKHRHLSYANARFFRKYEEAIDPDLVRRVREQAASCRECRPLVNPMRRI